MIRKIKIQGYRIYGDFILTPKDLNILVGVMTQENRPSLRRSVSPSTDVLVAARPKSVVAN